MARNKTTALEDMIEVTSYLPWWSGIMLAIISYLILHQIAGIEIPPMKDMHDMGGVFSKQMAKSFAIFLQYIVPTVCVIGALLSSLKQRQRNRIFNQQSSLDAIRKLSWQTFERLISEAYRRKGYHVEETSEGPDGGIDIILNKANRRIFVQCKHWKKQKVGVKEVRELNGIVAAKDAYSGILVTSGYFTTQAFEFAETCPIELVDSKELITLIPQIDKQQIRQAPSCPRCGHEMVKRTAKRGPSVGEQFWGCSSFPRCKGTVSL